MSINLSRAWYREPLVWLLIAFPLTAVIAGFYTLYLAIQSNDGLVVDDYYQKGKEINLSLARDRNAQQLGLHASVHLDSAKQEMVVKLSATPPASLPKKLDARWLHATRDGYDHTQTLERSGDGLYRAAFPELPPGHWYLQIETSDWRLQGSLSVPSDTRLELKPGHPKPPLP